jgi:hypothetical protein
MPEERSRLKDRTKRIDKASGWDLKPAEARIKKIKKEKKTYEEDFDSSVELDELKKKKEELLKGISEKSEAEKKQIQKELKKINDQIDELGK